MKKLQIKKAGKKFGDFWAVKDVQISILAGKITGFIGPNGAGKTTLFNLITGELKPDEGKIYYGDKNITGRQPWEIARMGIGKLYQNIRIFDNLKVIDNVIVALQDYKIETPFWAWSNFYSIRKVRERNEKKAMEWLEFVGLEEEREKLAGELSFGQQKLLSFARLMAGGFEFLLLDEPTAGVHPQMIQKIIEILKRLVKKKGITIAVIEHNMSVILKIADWVYFMNEGRIAFSGRTDHVLEEKEVRETYIGI